MFVPVLFLALGAAPPNPNSWVLPAPNQAAPNQAALDRMIATEKQFSSLCADVGIRDSFLRYYARDAISIQKTPMKAYDSLVKEPPEMRKSAEILSWYPVFGDISASGDLGYSTGPYFLETGRTRDYDGSFFTMWQRQRNGDYRVVLDVGTALKPRSLSEAPAGFTAGKLEDRRVIAEPKLRDVGKSEAAFCSHASSKGLDMAYHEFAGDDTWFFRFGMIPNHHIPDAEGKVRRWKKEGQGESNSRDLGFFYGVFKAGDEEKSYVHVWRRESRGTWRLAVDIVH